MARIRKIEIANFRGIQLLAWCPTPGINCLIGPGDSGKSTVLDAIDLCLGARRNVQFSDADFFGLDITTPISITLTLGDLDDSMRTLESFGAFLRGYHANTGVVEDEPSAGAEVVLCLNLTVASDLEPRGPLSPTAPHSKASSRRSHGRIASPWRPLGSVPWRTSTWDGSAAPY